MAPAEVEIKTLDPLERILGPTYKLQWAVVVAAATTAAEITMLPVGVYQYTMHWFGAVYHCSRLAHISGRCSVL